MKEYKRFPNGSTETDPALERDAIRMYTQENKSLREISKEVGRGTASIRRIMKRYQIPMRPRGYDTRKGTEMSAKPKTKVVHKFDLAFGDGVYLDLPKEIKVVLVGTQISPRTGKKEARIWIEYDPSAPKTFCRNYRVLGTGFDIEEAHEYIHVGSFQDEPFVWHVYEYIADDADPRP